MRRYLRWFAAGLAFCVGGAIAANLPFLTPQTAGNDFLPAINAFINQLNGGPGYTGVPQLASIGPACSASGASPQTCNGQRGQVTFTGLTIAAGAQVVPTINNTFAQAGVGCYFTGQVYSGSIGTNGVPLVVFDSVGGGQMFPVIYNAGANAVTSQSLTLFFLCM